MPLPAPEDLLWRPTRCMCLAWALCQYGRFARAYGDQASIGLQCQKSEHLVEWLRWIPHFHVTLKLPGHYSVWGYDPIDEAIKPFPPPWFKGRPVRDTPLWGAAEG